MTTLKEHEHLVAELHTNAFSKSTELLSHAVLDILAHLNATTAPNNNDALLANDLKACAPQNSSESARIKELEETVRHLRYAVDYWQEKALYLPEQAGCRKCDTQVQDGVWIEWGGGKCPVPNGTLVDVLYRDGEELRAIPANVQHPGRRDAHKSFWRNENMPNDIIAYRVVKP